LFKKLIVKHFYNLNEVALHQYVEQYAIKKKGVIDFVRWKVSGFLHQPASLQHKIHIPGAACYSVMLKQSYIYKRRVIAEQFL